MGVFNEPAKGPRVPCWGVARGLLCGLSFSLAVTAKAGSLPEIESVSKTYEDGPLIVRNDRGGLVGQRAKEVASLQDKGRAVELRGRVCLSSCTMYLGLERACVSPSTTFGFHGPSYYGRPLSSRDFEYWSQVIAAHYPPALKTWYLRKGRYKQSGYFQIKGSELIAMGIRRCQ